MYQKNTIFAPFVGMAIWVGGANAAMITASVDEDTMGVPGTTRIQLFLELDQAEGERVQAFEGTFDLTGLGSVANADWDRDGWSDWSSTAGDVSEENSQASVSLTSLDILEGDSISVGILDIESIGNGTFEVRTTVDDNDLQGWWLDDSGGVHQLVFTNGNEELLASAMVVPVPAAFPLFGSALAGLIFGAARRRSRGSGRLTA